MVDTAPPHLSWICVATLTTVAVACAEVTVTETATLSFTITEVPSDWTVPEPSSIPIADVEVCELDTDNCDETDFAGLASVTVDWASEVAFTFRKEGYGSILRADVSDDSAGATRAPAAVRMYTDEQLEAIAEQVGASYPWVGGVVGLGGTLPGTAWDGVTVSPAGATVDAVGESFYYDVDSTQYRQELEATTGPKPYHLLPLHAGGFIEVAPGEHRFEFGGTAGNCPQPSVGWPGGAPNTVRTRVLAGHVTYVSMLCDGE